MNILIVDDDRLMLTMFAKFLEDEGYEVSKANSGKAAIEMIKEGQNLDILITALKMPNGDGISLIEELKKLNNSLPVIVVSGHSDYDEKYLTDLGVKSFFLKPVNPVDFITKLKKFV